MKVYSLLAIIALTSAVTISGPEQMNSKGDDAYMAKVFEKYSTLGLDSEGDLNGRRSLSYQNAKWAARDVVQSWKGVSTEEAEAIVDQKFDAAWHSVEAGNQERIDVRAAYPLVR